MKQKLTAIISLIALTFIMALSSCAPIIEGTGGYGSGGGSSGESSSAGGGSSGGGSPSSGGGSSSGGGAFFTLKIMASNRRSAEDNLRASVTYEPVVTWTTEQGFRNAVKEFSVRVGNEAPQTVSLGGSVTSRTSYAVGSEVTVSYTAYADVKFTAGDGSSKTRREAIASETKRVRVAAQGTTVNFKVSAGLQTPESFTDESTGPKPTPDPEPQPQPEPVKGRVTYDWGDANTHGTKDGIPTDGSSYVVGDTFTVEDGNGMTWEHATSFAGWKANPPVEPEASGQATDAPTAGQKYKMPSGGVVLTAQWNYRSYNISYTFDTPAQPQQGSPQVKTQGAGTFTMDSTETEAALAEYEDTTKAWNFAGWAKSSNAASANISGTVAIRDAVADGSLTINAGNNGVTLFAVWTDAPVYDVTLVDTQLAGKEYWKADGNANNIVKVIEGKSVTSQDIQSFLDGGAKTGYTLTYNGNNFGPINSNQDFTIVESDISWTTTYTVTVDLSALSGQSWWNTGATLFTKSVEKGNTLSASDIQTEINNRKKSNFNVTYTGGDKQISSINNINVTISTADLDVKELFTIQYNWGTGITPTSGNLPQPQTVESGAQATVTIPTGVNRAGYNFLGWHTQQNQTSNPTYDANNNTITSIAQSYTLYAVWEAVYTVQYNANGQTLITGASLPANPSGTYKATDSVNIQVPSQPGQLASGKIWAGWATTSTGNAQYTSTQSVAINNLTANADSSNVITLYAKWKDGGATATVGSTTTTYETVTEAWNAAIPDGKPSSTVTITLLKNDTATETLYVVSGTVTLNVGTFTLTLGINEINLQSESNSTLGTLNIRGSGGTITGSGNFVVLVDGYGGNLTLSDGVTITSTGASTKGISSNDGGKFDMTGGTITGNKGGGVDISVTFNMSGGTISGNGTASSYFGGVNVSGGTFTMSGGTISGNNAANFGTGSGGGGVNVEAGGTFTMSGAAEVTPSSTTNNNIALEGGCVITVNAALSKSSVGQIALYDYTGTPTVLGGTAVAANCTKFTLADAGYAITRSGTVDVKLQSQPLPGYIIMNDGTVAASNAVNKDNAIAVVYKVDTGTRTAWAMGTGTNPSLKWAEDSAAGYSEAIDGLKTTVSGRSFSGYTDGSTGLGILQAAVNDANPLTSDKYPAWNYACNYSGGGVLSLGNFFTTGWYLPSAEELYDIYTQKTIIDNSLTYAIDQLYLTPLGTQKWWSSSTLDTATVTPSEFSGDMAVAAIAIDFSSGDAVYLDKNEEWNSATNSDNYGVCAVRQFTW